MKKSILVAAIASILSFSAIASQTSPASEFDFSKISPEQKEQIGKIASEYLVKNPEFLIQASQELQKKQDEIRQQELKKASSFAVENVDLLVNEANTPFVGPADAKVAMVIFTDYNCGYCIKSSKEISEAIKENPDVKFVFKELPVLAGNFPSSLYAAQVGDQVFKEKGNAVFLKYHEALYDYGESKGRLSNEAIDKIAESFGVTPKIEKDSASKKIQTNEMLAENLKISGTPGFVIMNLQTPNVEDTAIIPGYIDKAKMTEIINAVKKETAKQ